MSTSYKRFFWGAASALLLIYSLCSCVKANQTIGSVYVPTDRDLSVKTVSFELPIGMKMADTLQTSSSYLVLGNLYDDFYGATSAEIAATVTPPDTLPWGKNPVYKSAKLQFVKFSTQTYEDGQQELPQNVHVYALTKPMDTTTLYSNSFDEGDYSAEEIGLGTIIYTGGDTLTIPLKASFASKYMEATQQELDSADLFIKRFYGIYVKADEALGGGAGGRLTKFSSAMLRFTYNSTNDAGTTRDTTVTFTVGGSYGTEIYRHDTRELEVDGNNSLKTIYYEGMAGIKPHIEGEAIRDSIVRWAKAEGIDLNKVIVARASIELPYDIPEGDYSVADNYPSSLYPATRYKYAYGAYQYYPLSAIYDGSYSRGAINRSLQYYKPDVTLYVQNIMNMIAQDKELGDTWDLWFFNYYTGEDEEDDSSSSSAYSNYYSNYLYNMYYGGYGGYSSYGYSDYYDYYNMMNYYNYYNSLSSSSSSTTTVYYVDYINYCKGAINGNGADRRPTMQITYTVMQ